MVMDERRTAAWVMYALGLASQKEPARFAAISEVADGVNHAVPTQKELQTSLRWLLRHGLVAKHSGGYVLSQQGAALMASARAKSNTALGVWEAVTSELLSLQE